MTSQPNGPKPTTQAVETPTKRRWVKWTLMGTVVLLLLGGGGTGFYLWRMRAAAPEGSEAAGPLSESASTHENGILAFEPFVVNLADAEGSRFLRVNLRLLVNDGEAATGLQEDEVAMLKVRSAILELLSAQTSRTLVTPEGKAALKTAIAGRAAEQLDGVKVTDVLFSEFVVQF